MDKVAVKKRLEELHETIRSSPFKGFKSPSGQDMYVSTVSTKQDQMDESFDRLRLQLKYLLFDLEASRRESRYLRQMLENRTNRRPRGSD